MNILILANHFNAGGISSYILNLSRGLISRGHKVYVASGGGDWIERVEACGAKNIYLPLRTKSIISPKLLFAYCVLKKIIKSEGIDIIHAQTRVSGVLASWVSHNTGVPFVSTAHGFYQRRWGRRIFPGWGRFIIAISDPVKKHLIEYFGLNPERVILVHNGIDISRRSEAERARQKAESREQIREKYGLKGGPVVGIIARLSEVKGHKYLISALAKVKEQIPDVQLLSVGDGKIKKDLERQARDFKIDENVYFIPAVSDTAEPLSVMDIFAMPS
ncbi:glycosyltransferase family 1 protein, partial [bacterium]